MALFQFLKIQWPKSLSHSARWKMVTSQLSLGQKKEGKHSSLEDSSPRQSKTDFWRKLSFLILWHRWQNPKSLTGAEGNSWAQAGTGLVPHFTTPSIAKVSDALRQVVTVPVPISSSGPQFPFLMLHAVIHLSPPLPSSQGS